jgi:putative Mn2+ efflux pump MntP
VSFWQVVLIAIALGLDAFTVGFAVGMKFHGFYHVFRLAASFGVFQFGMYLVGKVSGAGLSDVFEHYGSYVSAVILFAVAGHMIYSSFKPLHLKEGNPTAGMQLVFLSVATSLDALGVGFGFGVLEGQVYLPAVVIGCAAFVMTIIGMRLGKSFSRVVEKEAEIAAAIILIFLGVWVLLRK